MPLNFRAFQSSLKTNDGEQLWYPILVKNGMVTLPQIAKKIAEKSSLTVGDVYNVVNCLISEMNDKLMNGHSVRLDDLGSFTAISKSNGKGVKTGEEVNANQIKALRIQFTPTSKRTSFQGVTRALFDGVEFQRWSGDPYNPQYKLTGPNNAGGEGTGEGDGEEEYIDPNA